MSTPICHRTLGPYTHGNDYAVFVGDKPGGWTQNSTGYACIGSACAMWVPACDGSPRYSLGATAVALDEDGDPYPRTNPSPVPNGLGWCADNLRREPWTDPQADATDGGEE